MRKRLFNENWEFIKTPFGTSMEDLGAWEKDFAPVDIPHDWLIYDTQNLYETSTGWYRKHFQVTKADGLTRLLRFDGVYMDSKIYVNGIFAGEWKYGYSTFEFDITSLLTVGDNIILVGVDHQEPNSRWYSGAGIFRNVWLKTVPHTHLTSDGIYVSTKKQGEDYLVELQVEVTRATPEEGAAMELSFEGKVITTGRLEQSVESSFFQSRFLVAHPKVWDVETPALYELKVTLDSGDTDTIKFGFRDFAFHPAQGFLANGKRVKLHGVCEHHDLGSFGAAFHKTALKRRFEILKAMGVNAIRTSHNMPAPELMELADEMGMYIVSEAFDMWQEPKTAYDYARFFDAWVERDVASWIRRDRNHPSVIMWSIGNEIHDTHEEVGMELTRRLMAHVEEHDPKRNAAVTIGSNYMPWQGAQNCADIVKLAGYNYAEIHYDAHHEKYPDWVIYGSETSSIVQSRGVYHFPLSESILTEEDEQCSALGNSRPSWAGKTVEYCILVDRDRKYAAGQFLWTGFDYLGEPTPYKTKNSYFGQIDTAGFPKDSYYMYQAEWTDYRKAPMVHLLPYWDFSPGQMIDVRVCTNAPKVEVFVNETSLGLKEIDHIQGTELFPGFQVPYEPGYIRAVAYDENNNVIAEEKRSSFGDSASIRLTPDKEYFIADGQDLVFVEISTVDADGNPVENAMDYVTVQVEGAGRLVGLDNGDSTDYDQYKGTCRKLFQGKLLAVIGAKTSDGSVTVTVKSTNPGIAPATLLLHAVASPKIEGVSAQMENQNLPLVTGKDGLIPVRKIELVSEGGQAFSQDKTEIMVKAYLYPANASDRDVSFSAVNDAGITSNLAEVEFLEDNGEFLSCLVRAKGDGAFRVRATTKNHTDKVKLLSQLEFCADGLGEAYLNPYGFIEGALYHYHKGDVGGFSEKSVASAQEGICEIGYHGLDFGDFGSDEITLPIFAMSGDPHYLQIWEGLPGDEGSELLADVVYQMPSTWDVYKPATYRLKRRIKGVTTLCLVTKDQRYFIKGFSFTKPEKAYETLYATESSQLYGDTFTIKEKAVEGIGNNVSLEFEDMDFGEKGFEKITICGRTKLPSNTIHIRFFGEDKEAVNQLVEFPHTEEYTELTFPLSSVTSRQTVGFIFLPGCDFDFAWFCFS